MATNRPLTSEFDATYGNDILDTSKLTNFL